MVWVEPRLCRGDATHDVEEEGDEGQLTSSSSLTLCRTAGLKRGVGREEYEDEPSAQDVAVITSRLSRGVLKAPPSDSGLSSSTVGSRRALAMACAFGVTCTTRGTAWGMLSNCSRALVPIRVRRRELTAAENGLAVLEGGGPPEASLSLGLDR